MTFWLSLPGFLTALAMLITALVGAGLLRGIDRADTAAPPQGVATPQVAPDPDQPTTSPVVPGPSSPDPPSPGSGTDDAPGSSDRPAPEGQNEPTGGTDPFEGAMTFSDTISPGFGVDLDRGAVPLEGYDVTGLDLTLTAAGLDLSHASAAALAPGATHPDDCLEALAVRSDPLVTVGQLSVGPVLLCVESSANTVLVQATYVQVPGSELVDLVYAYASP
ncbi:hypothetical protein [Ornithinimicrobium cavernae]|uniref:hypothetical protein n=1 Tax=Ornithinimicrobium cavernae TaxID=2666047 RepID=UPI000D695EE1|nr:hypothetical protein [Ornithinimicrobium cavernae]